MSHTKTLAALVAVALLGAPAVAAPARPAKATEPVAKVPLEQARRDLAGGDSEAAIAAARSLARAKAAVAVPALLDALAMGLPPDVAAAALEALVGHRAATAFDTLVAYASHRSARVRATALRALGALGDRRSDERVIAALADGDAAVRAAAETVIGERKLRQAVPTLLILFKAGDEATAAALAKMGDAEMARVVAEQIGQAPDAMVARVLGEILLKPEIKSEEARVEIVRALGKVPGDEAAVQLGAYVSSVPQNSPRQSRREAEALLELRIGGGK